MLGKQDLVLPILKDFPVLIKAKGAHGFTLLHHAKVGGEKAAGIVEFLLEQGLESTKVKLK